MVSKKRLRQRKEAALRKDLSKRAWYLEQMAQLLDLPLDAAEQDIEALLGRCKEGTFSSLNSTAAEALGATGQLPLRLVREWRDTNARLTRAREQVPRLERQFQRAVNYWERLEELTLDIIGIKRDQIDRFRAQLLAIAGPPAETVPDLRWSSLRGMEGALGEVHVLESSLRRVQAMRQRGDRALKEHPLLGARLVPARTVMHAD